MEISRTLKRMCLAFLPADRLLRGDASYRWAVLALFLLLTVSLLASCSQPSAAGLKSIKVGVTNIYFVPCAGGWLQIDCTYPDKYQSYLEETAKAGIDPRDVKYLLLTHHHDDHAGFAAELMNKQDVVLIVSEKAVAPLAEGASREDMRPVNGCVNAVFSIFSLFHGGFVFPPVAARDNDLLVKGDNGTLLKDIGVNGVILTTPGHTDDSISVVLADGSAFVGDVAMNFFGVCGIQHRPIYIKDIAQVYASWEHLKDFGASTIYSSHGSPFAAAELVPVQ